MKKKFFIAFIIVAVGMVTIIFTTNATLTDPYFYFESPKHFFIQISSRSSEIGQTIPILYEPSLAIPNQAEIIFIGNLEELTEWAGIEFEIVNDPAKDNSYLSFEDDTLIEIVISDYGKHYFYNSAYTSILADYLLVLNLLNMDGYIQQTIIRPAYNIPDDYIIRINSSF